MERWFMESLDRQVERWNLSNPVGTRVEFGGDGAVGSTVTTTLAFVHKDRVCVCLSAPPVVADLTEVWPC
jgi:hypothetical protein